MSRSSSIFGLDICFLAIFVVNAYGISTDCPSLVIFAQGLGMQNKQPGIWTSLQGDCCTASGVTCVSQRVTQIQWGNMGLNGIINGAALPSNLTNLYLYMNQLNGSIPSLPSNLTYLHLDLNQLTGSIPTLPSGLTDLNLGENQLTGNISSLPSGLTYSNLRRIVYKAAL